MPDTITCPRCSFSFEPSALLRARIESEVRQQADADLVSTLKTRQTEHEAALKREAVALRAALDAKGKLESDARGLADKLRKQELDIERRVVEETQRARTEAEQEARKRFAHESHLAIDAKDRELAVAHEKLTVAVTKEAEVLRQKRELDDRAQTM